MKRMLHHKKQISFKRKMLALQLKSMLLLAVVLVLLLSLTAIYIVFRSAGQLALEQTKTTSDALDRQIITLSKISELSTDNAVLRQFVYSENNSNSSILQNNVSTELVRIQKMNSLANYVAILKNSDEAISYVGGNWVKDKKRIYHNLMNGLANAQPVSETTYINEMDNCFGTGKVIVLYSEICNDLRVYEVDGYLCILMDEDDVYELFGQTGAEPGIHSVLLSDKGIILSCGNKADIGTIYPGFSENTDSALKYHFLYLTAENGLSSCKWSIVSKYYTSTLMGNYFQILSGIIFVAIGIIAAATLIERKKFQNLNSTLSDLQNQMALIANGDMRSRMNESYREVEFHDMARSFNKMEDAVISLMDRVKQEEKKIWKIQMNAMQSQIQPHFLYNTMDIIHWQAVMDGNKTISRLVKELGQYYRLSLSGGKDIVPISWELQHIEHYLFIQNVRYGDILLFEKKVPEALMEVRIPKMTLQPIVENAIEHGIKERNDINKGIIKGIIRIVGDFKDRDVVLTVQDNGKGMSEEQTDEINKTIRDFDANNGYGIRNVNCRLELYFGETYGLHFESEEGKGTTVTIRLPNIRTDTIPESTEKEV